MPDPIALHVAPDGHEPADGSRQAPLASPRAALRRLRILRQHQPLPPGGAVIWLHAGTYFLDQPLLLEETDSGAPDAPIVFQPWNHAEVRLSGARAIPASALLPVTEPALLNRLPPAVRPHLRRVRLAELDIPDTGSRHPHGFAFPEKPADLDLFHHDRPLPLARWPRTGYAAIGPVREKGAPVPDPCNGLKPAAAPAAPSFQGDLARIRAWSCPRNLSAFGMWGRDWAPSTVPLACLDPDQALITLAHPVYAGVTEGRNYAILNALEEIAQPGDWAVDHETRTLYLYPPEDHAPLRLSVAVLEEPLVTLRNASHIQFRELILEGGRSHGIAISGDHNLVAGCTLRNLGGRAVHITGTHNAVRGCDIYGTGQGGIALHGGNRRTLEPAGNLADNNDIHDFNRVATTYKPGVWIQGCGQHVAHNRIHDAPHNAILLHGNDHLLEFNEIHDVALDTDDAAAFYMGRNPSEQGNVIRHNFFHHIGSPAGWGTSAIYPDDGASGLTVFGNIFYRCGHAGQVAMGAIFINGGKDHIIENNIFVDCRLAVGILLGTPKGWATFVRGEAPNMPYVRQWLYEDVDIRSAAYLTRYPWLRLEELLQNPFRNTVRRNLAVRVGKFLTPEDRQLVADNRLTGEDPGFTDPARLDFSLPPDSPVYTDIPGFQPIPFREIGLRRDAFRRAIPAQPRLDALPDIPEKPVATKPGDSAIVRLTIRLANLSPAPAAGRLDLWTAVPDAIRLSPADCPAFSLRPGEVKTLTTSFAASARPDRRLEIGVRVPHARFSLPIPVRFRYEIQIPRHAPGRAAATEARLLAAAEPFPFLHENAGRGELRLALFGDWLALHAWADDARTAAATWPLQPEPGFWNGAYLGLLAAPAAAATTDDVGQVLFFPHGPGESGTAWSFHGIRQVEPDPALAWSAAARAGTGWELRARLPLEALGVSPLAAAFRFEAMLHLVLPGETQPRLLTLFGSKTARLELETLAHARLQPAD